MTIRIAQPHENEFLTELAFRSKSYWPYDKNLLQEYKSELEVFEEDIEAGSVYVGELNGDIIGFFGLSSAVNTQRLHFLFLEPSLIGKGFGKALWLHGIALAKSRGWMNLSFFADAYAVEAFYKHQGCEVIGSRESKLGQLVEMSYSLKEGSPHF